MNIFEDDISITQPDISNSIKGKYGFLPTSLWYCTKKSPAREFIADEQDYLIKTTGNKGGTTRMSEFDPEVADRIITYWSGIGDTILDPFCGRATRAICSSMLNRNYVGYEISPKHYEFTKWRSDELNKRPNLFNNWGKINIILGDGVMLKETPDNTADLIMTCPPYWDIEKYESVEGQLSDITEYDEFQKQMAIHAKNAFAKLKNNKFAVYIVNDFKRNGLFYDWHNDIIRDFKVAGFKLHEIIINKVNSVAIMGVGFYEKNRNVVKLHEYILVFKKP